MDLIDEEVLTLMQEGALTACHRHLAEHERQIKAAQGAEKLAFHQQRHAHWREIERRIPTLVEAIRRAGVGVGD